jgi:hypothetical protein
VTAKNQNFEMVAGDSKNVVVTTPGSDWTGATAKWVLKKSVSDTSNLVFKSTGDGGVSISNPTGGEITIKLDPVDTINLKGSSFYHEAEVTDAQGNVSTVMVGNVRIYPTGV